MWKEHNYYKSKGTLCVSGQPRSVELYANQAWIDFSKASSTFAHDYRFLFSRCCCYCCCVLYVIVLEHAYIFKHLSCISRSSRDRFKKIEDRRSKICIEKEVENETEFDRNLVRINCERVTFSRIKARLSSEFPLKKDTSRGRVRSNTWRRVFLFLPHPCLQQYGIFVDNGHDSATLFFLFSLYQCL